MPAVEKQARPTPLEGGSALRKALHRSLTVLREFFYGMTVHEMDVAFRKEKGDLENLFMLVVFGDLVGLPLLPLITRCDSCLSSFPRSTRGKDVFQGRGT